MYLFNYKNIKKLRIKKNLTQTEFAKIIRKSKQAVHQWENGLNKPSMRTIELIANVFGVDPNYFFDKLEYPKERA